MRRDTWNTYQTRRAYSGDVANHAPSTGGVHYHQVRKTRKGWEHRILQVNGCHVACGASVPLSAEAGEVYFREALRGC